MKIAVIEDESLAAKRLVRLISELRKDVVVDFQTDSVEDAVVYFDKNPDIQLAFMDVQLADGISLDIFQHTSVNVPVIFTTAYDHYAVKAFKVNSIDYLLKPIETKELERALHRYDALFAQKSTAALPDLHHLIAAVRAQQGEFRKRFLVRSGAKLVFISIQNVAYFFSDEGSTFIVNKDNERYLIEHTLDELEAQLNPEDFFRINRGMIVQLQSIKKIEPHFNNRLLLEISPAFETEITVSRHRASAFKSWLNQ